MWWAEGTKSRRDKRWRQAVSYPVEITNTNPAIIKIFLDFLRYDIEIHEEKLHLQIQIHEGDDQAKLEEYWSILTAIPKERFNKTIIRPVGNKVGKSRGTCKIRFADKVTYLRLQELLLQVLDQLEAKDKQLLQILPGFELLV